MKKVVSLALLVGGSNLTILGVNAYTSAISGISRPDNVTPAKKAKLMLIVSVVLTIIGLVGLLRGSQAI